MFSVINSTRIAAYQRAGHLHLFRAKRSSGCSYLAFYRTPSSSLRQTRTVSTFKGEKKLEDDRQCTYLSDSLRVLEGIRLVGFEIASSYQSLPPPLSEVPEPQEDKAKQDVEDINP